MKTYLKKTYKYILLLMVIASLTSCCRTIDCETGYLNIATINFSRQESDSFILRRYKINSNLLIDSLLLARNVNTFYTDKGPDTSYVIINETNPFRLTSGYDYELFFPATNTLRKITSISETKTQQRVCLTTSGKRCFNDLNSYKVDGVLGNNFNIPIYK